jgi:hypothetical protein
LKHRNEVADMNVLCEEVERDWSGSSAFKASSGNLRDSVHAALGRLIKQRKVYYTGNKGYFLVTPAENGNSPLKVSSSSSSRIAKCLQRAIVNRESELASTTSATP